MRAIILAAGRGKRLKGLHGDMPKCMLPINGKPNILRQFEALDGCHIVLVLGYKADEIMKAVNHYPNLDIIFNKDYATTNNIYSMQMALDKYCDEDSYVLNGDVAFEAGLIKSLDKPNCAAVEFKKVVPEETQVILKDNNEIIRLGKDIGGCGEAIGIHRLSKDFLLSLKEQILKMGKDVFYIDAMNKILPHNYFAVDIGKNRVKEIDFAEDYEHAKELFK